VFESETGLQVKCTFGPSSELAKLITHGKAFDLFAADSNAEIARLEKEGLVERGTTALFARGRLVLWIPSGAGVQIERIEDVACADCGQIGIANPELSLYGRAALQALDSYGVLESAASKIVYGDNVRQVKQMAIDGTVQAAFLPHSLVKQGEGRKIEVDDKSHLPVDNAIAVLKASNRQDAAKKFEAFILSDRGQELLRQHGYERPPVLVN
jgi:molybdate transport system substrate-binding protein